MKDVTEFSDEEFSNIQSFWMPLTRDCAQLKSGFIDLQDLNTFLDRSMGRHAVDDSWHDKDGNFRLRMFHVLSDYIPILFGRIFDSRPDTLSLNALQATIESCINTKHPHVISEKIKKIQTEYRDTIQTMINIRHQARAHTANPLYWKGGSIKEVRKKISDAKNAAASTLLPCPIIEICDELEKIIKDIEAISYDPPS